MRNEISLLSESQIRSIKDIDEEKFEEIIMEIDIKKPITALAFYMKELRDRINCSLDVSAIMKDDSSKWTTLPEEEKKRYREMHEEDLKRYKTHLALVKKYILEKPLREGATSYKIFLDEFVKQAIENDEDPKEARKEGKLKWKTLSKEEKAIYEDKKENHKGLYDSMTRMKGPISGYSLFVKDQLMQSKEKGVNITLVEVSAKWKKLKQSIKEKYSLYADELREERERMRDLYEITLGIHPRRPLGAFNFFVMEQAKEGKLDGKKNSFKEASKLWAALNLEQKERYQKIAKRRQLAYIVKKQEFKKNNHVSFMTPVNLFINMNKKDWKGDIPNDRLFSVGNEKWKNLEADEKKKYIDLAKQKNEEIKSKLNANKHKIEQPKRPIPSYCRYLKEMCEAFLKKNKDSFNFIEFSREISIKWKALNEDEKKKYQEAYQKDLEDYRKKLNEYNENQTNSSVKESEPLDNKKSNKKNAKSSRDKSNSKHKDDGEEIDTTRSKKPKKSIIK
jgi:hypothetical protein